MCVCSVHNHRSFLPGFGDPSLNKLDEFARNTAQRESGNSDRRGVIHGMACQEKMTASNNYNHHESTIQKNKTKHPNHQNQKEGMGGLGSTLSIRSTVLQAPFQANKNSSKIFAELKILETKHVEPQKMIKHVYIYI